MKSPLGNFIRDPEFTGFSRALDRNFKFTAGILTVSAIYYYCYEANRHCDAFSVSTTRALLWDEPSRKGDERPRPPTVPEVLIGNPARSFAMVVRNVFRRMNVSFGVEIFRNNMLIEVLGVLSTTGRRQKQRCGEIHVWTTSLGFWGLVLVGFFVLWLLLIEVIWW